MLLQVQLFDQSIGVVVAPLDKYRDADTNMKMSVKARDFWKAPKKLVLIGHENADNSNLKRRVQSEMQMQVIIRVLQELKTVNGDISEGKAQFLKDLLSNVVGRG